LYGSRISPGRQYRKISGAFHGLDRQCVCAEIICELIDVNGRIFCDAIAPERIIFKSPGAKTPNGRIGMAAEIP